MGVYSHSTPDGMPNAPKNLHFFKPLSSGITTIAPWPGGSTGHSLLLCCPASVPAVLCLVVAHVAHGPVGSAAPSPTDLCYSLPSSWHQKDLPSGRMSHSSTLGNLYSNVPLLRGLPCPLPPCPLTCCVPISLPDRECGKPFSLGRPSGQGGHMVVAR